MDGYKLSALPFNPPVIGYLCRMSEYFGLGILVDAFINLKKESEFKDLKLYITGGYTADDKNFVNGIFKKLKNHNFMDDVEVFEHFNMDNRVEFLKSLTLLSVPVPTGEAFGVYQVEAAASGVPVVQPNVGCYPEFVEVTGGGVIYEPNNAKTLANTIAELLKDRDKVKKLGEQGRKIVRETFTLKSMAEKIVDVYRNILK
jgi:glycosyltransferase involved in cell wall biosynthesis